LELVFDVSPLSSWRMCGVHAFDNRFGSILDVAAVVVTSSCTEFSVVVVDDENDKDDENNVLRRSLFKQKFLDRNGGVVGTTRPSTKRVGREY
jgi:hypothetical protein